MLLLCHAYWDLVNLFIFFSHYPLTPTLVCSYWSKNIYSALLSNVVETFMCRKVSLSPYLSVDGSYLQIFSPKIFCKTTVNVRIIIFKCQFFYVTFVQIRFEVLLIPLHAQLFILKFNLFVRRFIKKMSYCHRLQICWKKHESNRCNHHAMSI